MSSRTLLPALVIMSLLWCLGCGGSPSSSPPPPTPQPSFTISVSPTTTSSNPLSVKIATTGGSITIGVVPQNGFKGIVNFSLSGLPTGVSASPATWSLSESQTQFVTLASDATASSGPTQVNISGTSGALSASSSLFLRIQPFLSATIGPNGGTLAVTDSSSPLFGLELDIPAGALSQSANIELNPVTDLHTIQGGAIEAVTAWGVYLQPDGLTLNVPATLRMPYPDLDQDGVVDSTTARAAFMHISVFDPTVNKWFYLPTTVNTSERTVEAQILTFSLFRAWYWKLLRSVKYRVVNLPHTMAVDTSPSSVNAALARAIYAWAKHMKLVGITFSAASGVDIPDIEFEWMSFSGFPKLDVVGCVLTGATYDQCIAAPAFTAQASLLTLTVFFNDDKSWTSDQGSQGDWNIQAVATHEMGHVLGLDHFSWPSGCPKCVTSFQPPVMAPYGTAGRRFFKPFVADLAALYNLYAMSRSTEVAYVTNQGSDSVSVVQLSDNAVIANIPLASGSFNGPQGIAIDDDRGKAYVAVYDAGKLYINDLNRNNVWPFLIPIQTGTGSNEIAVTPDDSKAFVTNFLGNTVSVVELADPRNGFINLPVVAPDGAAVSPDGAKLLVTSLTGDLAIIDLASLSEASLSVGQKLEAVAVEPNGRYAFAADAGSGLLSVVNICPQRNLTTGDCQGAPVLVPPPIPVGQNPLAILLLFDSSSLHTAYVSNFVDGTITVIDVASCLGLIQSGCHTQTVPGFTNPVGMALTPDGKRLYVADYGASQVRIVDTSTNQLLDQPRIAVGTNPVGIAITSHPIPAFFDFALDSLSVQGNISPSFADGFDDGSLVAAPTSRLVFEQGITGADESDGYLRFRSNDGARVREDFLVDSATVTPALNKGAGDSTSLAVFRPDIPALGQFYCLGIEGIPSGTESTQMCVAPASSGPMIELGSPVNVVESHPLPISGTSPVALRLKLLDSQGQLVASFSTDGGRTFTDFQTVRTIFAQDTAFFVYVQASAKLPFISVQQMTSSRTSELRAQDTAERLPTARMPSPPDVRGQQKALLKSPQSNR